MYFSKKLIAWYYQHKRDLPWRGTKDAYKIWVSEIIMQQTRVEQGLNYYKRFVEKYPNVFLLAATNENELLKIWQGLGYYSRARNMHLAAKQIVEKYNGIFPVTYSEIIKIKGIGKYSAAAILSFAYELPYPVMDGNVKRVLSRYYSINTDIKLQATEKNIFKKLEGLFDLKRPSDFNQAIMEFGALQCKINKPDCTICIFKDKCKAFLKNKVDELPVVSKKSQIKIRYFYYFIPLLKTKRNTYTYFTKREEEDIWKHLFQFPLIETEFKLNQAELLNSTAFKALVKKDRYKITKISEIYSHKLSHQLIQAVFIHLDVLSGFSDIKMIKIKTGDIEKYAISRLTEKYLKQIKL